MTILCCDFLIEATTGLVFTGMELRPFGVSLLVAGFDNYGPQLYQHPGMMMERGFLASPDTLASPLVSWLSYGLFGMGWRQPAKRIPQVRFKHCYREANRCDDKLARMGGQQSIDFTVYDCPLVEIVFC
ncbi:uncharacterized protein LOC142607222 [Castanea sativa]|uniref:uncharacterized protein LOC142607222 n=1 Tax=Castanea sativa TaxID=21020 RepID=UPI003F651D44